MKHKVFISKGTATTPEQTAFVTSILDTLELSGLDSRIMNGNEWSHEQPLKAIKKVISECEGLVIIAFTRSHFDSGYEYQRGVAQTLNDISLPTTWNHIEGALAYSLGMPILVIAEDGLKSEGLIEQGYDWRVYWTSLDPDISKAQSFRGVVESWKSAIQQYSESKKRKEIIDLEKLTPKMLFHSLTIAQIAAVLGTIISILVAVSAFSYKYGSGKFPWDS
ncbi:hypothetical protein [Pedobacter sp. P26]|uniref:hypothetical protein n=1 Tax=Pedobacter sp. P26 TaxID=3423956 RepID=UPI003D677476